MAEQFTVFGANGFIGSALVKRLVDQGYEVDAISRGNWPTKDQHLGHVIYAAGMAANYRTNLQATLETQTQLPAKTIDDYKFASFLYLSSTRLYQDAPTTCENAVLSFNPTESADIYNLSKATTECYLLAQERPTLRVVRLSNVFGSFSRPNSFLAQILADAAQNAAVRFAASAQSSKDYVALEEVVDLLISIALRGAKRVYNIARGENTTHAEIADELARLGVSIEFESGGATHFFPPIDTANLREEFEPPKINLLERLPQLLHSARNLR